MTDENGLSETDEEGGTASPRAIGSDLFWWRETGSLHTLVTVYWKEHARFGPVHLRCRLFEAGMCVAEWDLPVVEDQAVLIDSAHPPAAVARVPQVVDGVLLVSAIAADAFPNQDDRRLYGLIDWYSDDGTMAGLHSDQALMTAPHRNEFTEIVVEETGQRESSLVVLNGPDSQPAGAIVLTLRNWRGETRSATYARPIPPWVATRLRIRDLFPDATRLAAGRQLTVSGVFDSTGLYTRPYVVTEGAALSAYHGGDIYDEMPAVPRFAERFLDRGRVNPMFAVHRDDLTTAVNLFNSHGRLEEDFGVDAYLYDDTGRLVAERPRWLTAERHGCARGEIAELLPDATRPFVGHVTLAYSAGAHPEYPFVLQALLEYRSARGVARVMAWSDEWNSPQRAAVRGRVSYRAYNRVWCRAPFLTTLCITNCGNERRYDQSAPFTAVLRNAAGGQLRAEGVVPPHGTVCQPVDRVFPDAADFLAPIGVGVVVIESDFDLAEIQLTHHASGGGVAAEHFMALTSRRDGEVFSPSGW